MSIIFVVVTNNNNNKKKKTILFSLMAVDNNHCYTILIVRSIYIRIVHSFFIIFTSVKYIQYIFCIASDVIIVISLKFQNI